MTRRKDKAQKIAKEQELNEKRYRIHQALVQKLLVKHGPKTNQGLSKNQISDYVRSYLENLPSIVRITSIRNVDDLALNLSTELCNVQPLKSEPTNSTNHIDIINDSVKKEKKELIEKANDTFSMLISSNSQDDNLEMTKVNPWTLIETYQIVENEHSMEEKKIHMAKKKRDMAKALNDQIRLKNEVARKEKAEDDNYLAIELCKIKEWEEEKLLNERVEQQRTSELKMLRQEQVVQKETKRKQEQIEKISNELREIENIKDALQREEEERYHRKQIEREKWDRITTENTQKLEQRRLQKKQEAEMDAKLMADWKKKYDDEERRRAQALEDRKVKMVLNGQLLKEAGAFNQRDEMIKFEKKLLEASEARERAQAIREKKKSDEERKKKQLITECNKKMAEEKLRLEKETEKENEAYALKCLKEKEALLREEEAELVKQHETKVKYRKFLQNQMNEQKQKQAPFDGMTVVERSMNKKLMMKLENSDAKREILEKVLSCACVPNNN